MSKEKNIEKDRRKVSKPGFGGTLSPHVPIGTFLQQVKALDSDITKKVLQIQKKHPSKMFGQIALEQGLITDDMTRKYLSRKGFF
jgi:hypothetical protein